ncbi:MAG TPA: hypothetical protein VIL42_00755 [Sphingomicrobium sp.]
MRVPQRVELRLPRAYMTDMRLLLIAVFLLAAGCRQADQSDRRTDATQPSRPSAAQLIQQNDPDACKHPDVQQRILSELAPRALKPFGIVTADDLEAAQAELGDFALSQIEAVDGNRKDGTVRCRVRLTAEEDYGVYTYSLQGLGGGAPAFSLTPGAFVAPMFKHRGQIVSRALEVAQQRSPLRPSDPPIGSPPPQYAPRAEPPPRSFEPESNVPSGDPLAPLPSNDAAAPETED